MSTPFIRAEVLTLFKRWREVIFSLAVVLWGLRWYFVASGLLVWVGAVLALIGGAATLVAFQRARFASLGGGVGVVQLIEGQLFYFGPLNGGAVTIDDIVAVGIDPSQNPAHWVLSDADSRLLIPVDARGADALFDVFSQLPGMNALAAAAARERADATPTTLWQREAGIRHIAAQ